MLSFFTLQEQEGLIEAAHAIANLNRHDIVFAIVGTFPSTLEETLRTIDGVSYTFIGNQPIDSTPQITSIGDVCLLLQDSNGSAAQFHVPAGFSYALGMNIPVLSNETLALADAFQAGVLVPVNSQTWSSN